ncbi:MAG: hypothetical protein U0270_07685 [Labilithrix sp.]
MPLDFSVPHDTRSWSQLDARWREGFCAACRVALAGELGRITGHGGVVLEVLSGDGAIVAPAARERGTPT